MYFMGSGWPSGWGEPPTGLVSFDPPRFGLPPTAFQHAHPAGKADVKTTARALVSAVREVHKDPATRNIYINPNRSDQAIVFTDKWAPRMLDDATKVLFDHLVQEIECELSTSDDARKKALSAMCLTYAADQLKVIRASTGDMVASMQFDGRLPEPTKPPGLPLVRVFGREQCNRLDRPVAISVIEYATIMYDPTDSRQIREMSVNAIISIARELLRNPENYNVVMLAPDVALTSAMVGWVEMMAKDAARIQFTAAGVLTMKYIKHDTSERLQPIRAYIEEHLEDLVAAEIECHEFLTGSAGFIARHFAASTDPASIELCRRMAAGPSRSIAHDIERAV